MPEIDERLVEDAARLHAWLVGKGIDVLVVAPTRLAANRLVLIAQGGHEGRRAAYACRGHAPAEFSRATTAIVRVDRSRWRGEPLEPGSPRLAR